LKPLVDPQLLPTLAAERTALQSFVALLEREQKMLLENIVDQLSKLSESKSASVLELNELAEKRRIMLQKSLPQLDADTIHIWMETHSPQCLAIWQAILALAGRAQQLNRTNGELIQMKLRHNQQLLTALSNAVNKADLYGPDGQASFSQGSGRSLGSG